MRVCAYTKMKWDRSYAQNQVCAYNGRVVKLQRRMTRKAKNGKEYQQWSVNLPSELVERLGWTESMELRPEDEGGVLFLCRAEDAPVAVPAAKVSPPKVVVEPVIVEKAPDPKKYVAYQLYDERPPGRTQKYGKDGKWLKLPDL